MHFSNSLRSQPESKKLVSLEVKYDDSISHSTYADYSPYYDVHTREYWMSPSTRNRLVKFGLLSKDGKLVDPDKDRMRIASAMRRVATAESKRSFKEYRARADLIAESAWLEQQLLFEMKRKHVDACKARCMIGPIGSS